MRRSNSSIKADFISEKGSEKIGRTYFAYIPLEDMVCYAVAESYDGDNDINSAKLAVESVLVAFERNPSFRNIRRYIQYAHDQIVSNSVKNKLETAITVVVSDYTRICYASCGNIKFYLLSDNAFYLKSKTQTYYQFFAQEYGLNKADIAENRNLLQYLGKSDRPKPFVSKKIPLPEESTMLLATRNLWERVDDVEILDAYEEAKPEEFLGNIEDLFLLTQIKNPTVGSYSLASMFVEKTYKEDTAKKKKRQRIIVIGIVVLLILAIIASIVISSLRATDRNAMAEIQRLDGEGIRYSNYGNYAMAYEQYEKASELTGKLRNNLQYARTKRELTARIAERWHLFNSIMSGDSNLASGNYPEAQKAYQDAINAYYDIYEEAGTYSGLLVGEILSGKLEKVEQYIAADTLIKVGEFYETEELFQEALAQYKEAEDIVKNIGDLDLRKDLMTRIFEADRKMNSVVEVNFIREVKALMERAEGGLNYQLALQYADFILNIYRDLGVKDETAENDKARIERKINLETDVEDYIRRAQRAEAESRYDDAINDYQTIMELYGEMEIGVEHERFRTIMDAIVRVEALKERAAQAAIDRQGQQENA